MAITRIKNNQITDATITNVKILSQTLTGDLMNPNLTFNSNLTLNGNLIVTGNVTAVQSTTTQITDPLLTLGLGNAGTSYDLGLILIRGSGGNRFIGWKENQGAFVFINTTEDGLTTGNIATTAYANVIFGNATTLGSSTFGGITLSGNTISAAGALTVRSDAGTVTIPNSAVITGSTILSSTLSVSGATTVASLTSNAGIIGTTGSFSSNLTGAALTVNASATIGTTLGVTGNINGSGISLTGSLRATGPGDFDGGLQSTPIGNAAPSTALFTTVGASSNATVAALTVNGTATIGSTLGVTGTLTGAAAQFTTVNGSGTATLNALTVNNSGTVGTTLTVGGTATVNALVSNGAIQGTTLSGSGNATVAGLTVNASAVVGTTLQAVAGIQATPIGNVTAASGSFTTLNATGAITGATTITTTGAATHSALTVNGAATVGTTLITGGTATVNALVSNTSITAASGIITGNLIVEGNLAVLGNLSYINVDSFTVEDPIIQLNTGPNGAPLSVDNNFDSGVSTNYFDTADRRTFFGRKDSSGFFEYFSNVTNETGNVVTGTYGTIKSGNLQLVSAATIGTTLVVGGNATVNALTINNSATVGTTLGVTGNLAAGNVSTTKITAVDGIFTNNLTVAGTLTATSNVVANTSGIFYGNAITGNGAIYAGVPGFTTLVSNVVAQFAGNVNNYSQINFENTNGGSLSSSDFVHTAAIGDDSTFFADFGLGGSTHNDPAFFGDTGSLSDAYLYVVANGTTSGSTSRGNLLLGSTNGVVKTFVGNTAQANVITTHSATQFAVNVTTASTNSTTGALVVAGGAGIAGAINGGSTLNIVSTATVNSLVSNGAVSGTTAQFTTINGSGNATVAGLTVNASAVVGTTLQAVAGIQATPIGNITASSGAFTTLTSNGLTTFTNATDSSAPTNGAVVITGGLGVGKDLNVTTEANIGNVTINNLTIGSNITNQGLNINPNGTGVTTINSGLNTSRTVINGTAANTLVVSGTQVGVNTSSFISGATFQVNALDSMLLPKGAIGDRPGSPSAGMIRFSTSQGTIEWYNGTSWSIPTGDFTVVVANSQTGNGSDTLFTLPVSNASTAGTIVSINGVVQQPTSAYSITGANVTFTEAPASTDVIDFRVFTTTTQVTAVTDIAGTTGLFYDLPSAGSQITVLKTAGAEKFSIQANGTSRFTGNVEPSANVTYSLGTTTNRWKDLWLSGTTIYLGNIQIQNTTGNTVSFLTSTGAPAALTVDISDPSGIQSTPIGNATPSSGAFTTLSATTSMTVDGGAYGNVVTSQFASVFGRAAGPNATSLMQVKGNDGTAGIGMRATTGANSLIYANASIDFRVGANVRDLDVPSGGTTIATITSTGLTVTGTISATDALTVNSLNSVTAIINGGSSGTGNIGASGAAFNTVFAKATTAQYADLAENYSADADYEPGTVVHFGGSQEVTLCNEDMCRRVAGVVSTNPAYLMNSDLAGIAAAVALQGRVPCKVRGAVRKGDMMVSAGAGYARAEADPVLGSIIGKALENFTGTEGVIEVVVGRV